MTEVQLDELVLCKPYFDRNGLIVAEDDSGQQLGFTHAAFGPSADQSDLDYTRGTTCLVMVKPGDQQIEIAARLLEAGESYLREGGATLLYGGGLDQTAPYYHGLYGGSSPPGILLSDALQTRLFRQAGYESADQRVIVERRLVGFRPPIDRDIMQIRRKYKLDRSPEPLPAAWWSACTWGQLDIVRFELVAGRTPAGWLAFWDVEPLASSWGVHAMGLLNYSLDGTGNDTAIMTYLLGESMREMQSHGVTIVEAQVREDDGQLRDACLRLGFTEVDKGIRYRKQVTD
jgi:hypothetical protein